MVSGFWCELELTRKLKQTNSEVGVLKYFQVSIQHCFCIPLFADFDGFIQLKLDELFYIKTFYVCFI